MSFWTTTMDRLQRLGTNAHAGVPLGYLMTDGGRPTGVVLTPASTRTAPDGNRALVVNLSSWHVEPSHRFLASLMLQKVLRGHDALYTDLTPSEGVMRMLPSMGFMAINDGVVLTALPVAAMLPSKGAAVHDLIGGRGSLFPSDMWDLLEAHSRVGCFSAMLTTEQGHVPLMFRRRRLKGLPAANLIYCEDITALQKHLSAVARYLLGQGIVILVHDSSGHSVRVGQAVVRKELKFAKPGGGLTPQRGRIDHVGSELSLMDF